MIRLTDIHTYLNESHILQGISAEIEEREFVALLGRNGVGKSTTMKSIIGLTPPRRGSIQFEGQEVIGKRPHEICRLGVGYVPEERRVFPYLTVRQNLMIGSKTNHFGDGNESWTIQRVYDRFPELAVRDRIKAGRLSGGEKQMLSISRALMGNPKLLLADEPMEGLAPFLVDRVVELLLELKKSGHAILLVEQKLSLALGLARRAYVMSKGKIVFTGTNEELMANKDVQTNYLQV